jgi:hypothetical protein
MPYMWALASAATTSAKPSSTAQSAARSGRIRRGPREPETPNGLDERGEL